MANALTVFLAIFGIAAFCAVSAVIIGGSLRAADAVADVVVNPVVHFVVFILLVGLAGGSLLALVAAVSA